MDGPWRIELLGRLRAVRGERIVERFRTRKTGLLLAHLALRPHRACSRDELTGILWPDTDPEAARISLRVALSWLRQALEPPGARGSVLQADRGYLQFAPGAVVTDVEELRTLMEMAARADRLEERRGQLCRALDLYRNPLLADFCEDWILTERETLAEQFFVSLHRLLGLMEAAGDLHGALQAACRASERDPLREEIQRDVIRLLARTGQPGAALRRYRELERLLETELGVTSSAATRALVQRLKEGEEKGGGECRVPGTERPDLPAPGTQHPGPRTPHPAPPPRPLSRFFGRAEEKALLRELLIEEQRRLVTLTGPGGSGKTRLALEVARELECAWQGAVWFVPLADLSDVGRIVPAIREALGLPATHPEPLEQVMTALRQRPSLLVLDNFEHLVEGGAVPVRRLLDQVATLTCLVTSRRRLDLEGEREVPVGPLPVPAALRAPYSALRVEPPNTERGARSTEYLSTFPSVQLFIDRARGARAEFRATPENAGTIAAICARLEGIPLAIELAAARIAVMTPRELLANLERRFDLLVSVRRDVPDRHRALWETLAWSYRLLAPEEQRFFARLSAFRGGWTREAAEAVCGEAWSVAGGQWSAAPEPTTDHRPPTTPCDVLDDVLDLLERLRSCSLVQVEESAGEMRFRMLETLREFAWEQLPCEERDALQRRHAGYYLGLVERAAPFLTGPDPSPWIARLERDRQNLRAALAWHCGEGGDPEKGLRLVDGLHRYWDHQGYWSEALEWADRALPRAPDRATPVRARVLFSAGACANLCGRPWEGIRLLEAALAAYRALGNGLEAGRALAFLGNSHRDLREFDAARRCYDEGLAIARADGDRAQIAGQLGMQALLAAAVGDYRRALSFSEESLAIYDGLESREPGHWMRCNLAATLTILGAPAKARPLLEECVVAARQEGSPAWIAMYLVSLATTLFSLGENAEARARVEEAMDLFREIEAEGRVAGCLAQLAAIARSEGATEKADHLYRESLATAQRSGAPERPFDALVGLGDLLLQQSDPAGARSLYAEALAGQRRSPNPAMVAQCLVGLAGAAAAEGHAGRAARWLGTAERLRATSGAVVPPVRKPFQDQLAGTLRTVLGEEAFRSEWMVAETLSLQEAVADADGAGESHSSPPPHPLPGGNAPVSLEEPP